MKIDIKQLRHLCEAIEQGSFVRAGAALNISQPALSKSVALLEHTVGAKLLERNRQGTKATIFGEVLARRYRRIEAELRQAAQEIDALKGLQSGSLTLGATRTAGAHIVPAALSSFMASYPNIAINVIEERSPELRALLLDRKIDLFVGPIYGQHVDAQYRQAFLFNSHLVVATRPRHPLSRQKSITMRDLAQFRFVSLAGQNILAYQVTLLLKAAGMNEFPLALTANSADTAVKVLAKSDYFTLLPKSLIVDSHTRVFASELSPAGDGWPFGVQWNSENDSNPSIEAFVATLKAVSQRFAADV